MLFPYNVKINAGDRENDTDDRVPEGSRAFGLRSAFGREIYPEMASISHFLIFFSRSTDYRLIPLCHQSILVQLMLLHLLMMMAAIFSE